MLWLFAFPNPRPLATSECFTVFIILPSSECHLLKSYSVLLLYMGFFHLAVCIYVSSMSFHSLIAHFFWALNNIPFLNVLVYLFIYLPKNILVALQFWQLWIKSPLISMYRFLCRHKFSNPLAKYQGAQLPNCLVRVCLTL